MSGYKYDDLEYYKGRCRELEGQLQRMDVRFNNVLSSSGNKKDYLQDSDIHFELERVSKQLAQKRNEVDLWRQKYETQLSSIMSIKQNYEMELAQLSQEVQRLLDKIDQFEFDQRDTQLLREQLSDKDCELSDLVCKLQRMQKQNDEEISRLTRENENLRQKINSIELERQKELEQMRFKVETYHAQNVDNLKKTHQSQIGVIESEIDKLRNLLEIKNSEIETLLNQNLKMKACYENQINEGREYSEQLKQRLQKQDQQQRKEQIEQQQRLQEKQKEEKEEYDINIKTLEQELKNLTVSNQHRCEEIEDLLKDKQNLRGQIEELLNSQEKYKFNNDQQNLYEQEIQTLKQLIEEQEQFYEEKQKYYEQEIRKYKDKDLNSNRDIENQIQQFLSVKQALENDLSNLRQENQIQCHSIEELEKQVHFYKDEHQQRLDRIRQLEQKIDQLQFDLQKCEGQSKNLSDKQIREYNHEIEILQNRLLQQESIQIKEFEELRQKLEESSQFQINNLKTAFNTQINILTQENKDLTNLVKQKEINNQDLLNKFQSLDKTIQSGQQIGPSEMASRNIYEMYLRSKNRQNSAKKL